MKDRALQLARHATPAQKVNTLREYVQAHVLFSLQSKRAFERLAFVGGTALHFVYGLRRFSEDLDFSLEHKEGYTFHGLLTRIEADLTAAGFEVTIHLHEAAPVTSAFIRLPGLLYEAGVTPHRTQKLSIKIEIDTNPPAGAGMETTLIDRHFLLSLWHHDLPSLMAGKIHALLTRPYTKGRDVYDLIWYLTRPEPIKPNVNMLRNALEQTGGDGPSIKPAMWKALIWKKLMAMDFAQVREDVAPFLKLPEERALLTRETIRSLFEKHQLQTGMGRTS